MLDWVLLAPHLHVLSVCRLPIWPLASRPGRLPSSSLLLLGDSMSYHLLLFAVYVTCYGYVAFPAFNFESLGYHWDSHIASHALCPKYCPIYRCYLYHLAACVCPDKPLSLSLDSVPMVTLLDNCSGAVTSAWFTMLGLFVSLARVYITGDTLH